MGKINNITSESLLPDNKLLDQFLELTTIRDLPTLLQQALQIMIDTFEAQAGSLFFQATPPQHIKIGPLSEQIQKHIDQWEAAVAERLRSGTWHILETDASLISVQPDPHHQVTLVNTPLLRQTQVTGSISLVLAANRTLSLSQRTLLTRLTNGIGQQGALAAELTDTQKRYKELDLLVKMSQVFATTLDVNELLENIMRLTANVLGTAAASIFLIDERNQELVLEVCHSPNFELVRQQRISLQEGIAGWVVTQERPVIVNDVAADDRFSRKVDSRTGFLTQSIAAVPLRLKGKTIGVLEALNKHADQGFDQDDLRLMSSIGSQAAITIENARLYQDLREERDKIMQAQEDVRRDLSRSLHDGTVQKLSAISMNLEYVQKLLEKDPAAVSEEITVIQKLTNKATKEARLVLFELRPIILETQGLLPALEKYVEQLNESDLFNVQTHLSPLEQDIGTNKARIIFSIIQEAVNNARKHAAASLIKIIVNNKDNHLIVDVKDNGVGFKLADIESDYAARNSFGLLNMKERARLIEATLSINSEVDGPQKGTTVTLSIPL